MAEKQSKQIGRPPAKHSHEDFAQMTIYLHRPVRSAVKVELLKLEAEGASGEFSGLVESLLRSWLKDRGVRVPASPLKGK